MRGDGAGTRSNTLRLVAMVVRNPLTSSILAWRVTADRRSAARTLLLRIVDRQNFHHGRDGTVAHCNLELLTVGGNLGVEDGKPDLAEARAFGRARQRTNRFATLGYSRSVLGQLLGVENEGLEPVCGALCSFGQCSLPVEVRAVENDQAIK